MTIVCARCHRPRRVAALSIEHVMNLCLPCFKWLMQRAGH